MLHSRQTVLILLFFTMFHQLLSGTDLKDTTLSTIKNATAFVKVEMVDGRQACGSGFVMCRGKPGIGYIATNAHVVPIKKTVKVQVVLNSGQQNESILPAQVVASDEDRDLAILRVETNSFPNPLRLSSREKLRETLGVWILGFPFGDALSMNSRNPAITISQGSVSSIRKDEFGNISALQIDGGINPGNSGGPVVDVNGDLIGISVATVVGAHIGIALPAESLEAMLQGRVKEETVTQKETRNEVTTFSISVTLIDPMTAVSGVSILIGPCEQVMDAKPSSNGRFEKPATAMMQEFSLSNREGNVVSGTFTVRQSKTSPSVFGRQIKLRHTDGKNSFTYPSKLEVIANYTPDKPPSTSPSSGKPITPGEESGGWLGANPKPGETTSGQTKQQISNKELLKPSKTVVDAQCSEIDIPAAYLLPLIWNPDATKVFIMEKTGKLHVASCPAFVEEQVIDLGGNVLAMALCKSGLLIAMEQSQEIIVLPLNTLTVSKQIPCAGIISITATPMSNTAIAIGRNGSNISVLDLSKGIVSNQYSPQSFARSKIRKHPEGVILSDFRHGRMSPDGSTFLCVGFECLHRFRINGTELLYEEMGPRIGQNPFQICISDDSFYVALPSGGGNYIPADHPKSESYSTFIYKVSNLLSPVITIPSGHYPRAIAFDKVAGKIYAQNYDTQLLTFNPRGIKEKEYVLSDRGDQVRQLLPHPSGKKLLVLTEKNLFWVDMSGKNQQK